MATQGPLYPGTATNDTSIGSFAWSNPSNAKISDGVFATASTAGSTPSINSVKIVKGGTIGGNELSDGSNLDTTLTYKSFGGSSELWGLSWTSADINSSGFGVAFAVQSNGKDVIVGNYLKVTNFGFSIPVGATINGILVEVEQEWSSGGDGGSAPSNVDAIRITVTYTPGTATVTTDSATSITTIDAALAGTVTSDGGNTITERGVCWATTANPTTSSSKATASGTTGSYTVSATGLTQSTTYHYRAYAINSAGTSYGSDQTFTTNGFTNPANAYADDSSYATTPGDTGDIWIQLSGDGGSTWTSKLTKTFTGTETAQTYGNGATELWGATWTNTNVNDTNFRLRIGCGTATWGEIYKTFGFSPPTSTMTGIEVECKAKWDGSTTSINYIAAKIHYGTSITPVTQGSFAYATDGGGGTGAPAVYNGSAWKELVDLSSTQTLTSKTYDTAGSGNVFKVNGTAISDKTGSGKVVLDTSPTLTTPVLGTPSALTLTNATGLPDGGLTLTDVTTNDVSASAHGFAPKTLMTAWTSWSPSPVGFSGSPTITAVYKQVGKIVHMYLDISGTSNATNFTFTLPVGAANTIFTAARVINAGAVQTSAMVEIAGGGTTALVFTTWGGGAFTASGTKQLNGFQAAYQAS